jgi:hydrogenase nickel incorporation protein HypB
MCGTCGCAESDEVKIMRPHNKETIEYSNDNLTYDYIHTHDEKHAHDYHHHHSHSKEIILEQDILKKNNLLAERNRGYFDAKNIISINLVSSPGSGKTTLLEKTISGLKDELPVFVIEGDQQTMNDAERIKNTGAPVVQINPGSGCHLDSSMVNLAVKKLEPKENSILFIENVGNLVCPSMFDLGENFRIVVISVTEGDDKPAKYPNMFESSDLCIINKTDLLPYVDFNVKKAKKYAMQTNQNIEFIELSAKTEDGLKDWINWLKSKFKVEK